jgi:predicted methyltransferase
MGRFIVSGFHLSEILRHQNETFDISLDLGMSKSKITREGRYIIFPDGQKLDIDIIKRANKRNNQDCFLFEKGSLYFIYIFENQTVYKLYEPHIDYPPTLWINGSLMHTVSVSNPIEDGKDKVKTLGEIHGEVLDTCFGLGYTAIELKNIGADKVYTYEISKAVLEIAKVNPWSKEAFGSNKILIHNSDIISAIRQFPEEKFSFILHDPPNVKINGDLYSLAFYKELYRVLERNGALYHFIGGGRIPREYKVNYTKGVIERFYAAGFKKVVKSYRGVVAYK